MIFFNFNEVFSNIFFFKNIYIFYLHNFYCIYFSCKSIISLHYQIYILTFEKQIKYEIFQINIFLNFLKYFIYHLFYISIIKLMIL